MDKIKLGIVDDHFHTRQSLKDLLSFNTGFDLRFVCESGKQFLIKLRELPQDQIPDIVLMDVDMPELDGIDTIAIAKTAYPSIRFLILTVYDDEDILFRAIKAGASGFLLKDEKMNVIEQHIHNLYKGIDAPMSPSIARKALSLIQKSNMKEDQRDEATPQVPFEVTSREIEVLQL
ncbi:MAG TPA: response regulator transcription factor, partial [Saprospiraceae bacterium]|nr:response regulator transcription factor [Saprospiraceae bacterium]